MDQTYCRIVCDDQPRACALGESELALVYGLCWGKPFPVSSYPLVFDGEHPEENRSRESGGSRADADCLNDSGLLFRDRQLCRYTQVAAAVAGANSTVPERVGRGFSRASAPTRSNAEQVARAISYVSGLKPGPTCSLRDRLVHTASQYRRAGCVYNDVVGDSRHTMMVTLTSLPATRGPAREANA